MADRLKEFVGDLPKDCTLLIPGTGVKDGMDRVVNKEVTVTFEECELGLGEGVSGHGRDISLGTVTHEGRKSNVVVLSRIHPNEDFADPELVRVPRHIIEALQPKIAGAIITNGVGGVIWKSREKWPIERCSG